MADYYNRYGGFVAEGELPSAIPFIAVRPSSSDIYIEYDRRRMRMDMLSYKYYGDPNYDWLILQANPNLSGYQYSIPDGVTLRIPYPLDTALQRYEKALNTWKTEHM